MQDLKHKTHELTRGATIWMTGLSGSGKSTLSEAVKEKLNIMLGEDRLAIILDGDIIRKGLNSDLGFEEEDIH